MAAAYQGPRGDTNGSETPLLEPLLPRGGDVGDASVLGDREGSDHYQQGSHRCDEPRKNSALGLGLMLLSALFFSTMTMLVKVATRLGVPSLQVVLARSAVQLAFGLVSAMLLRIDPLGPRSARPWMLLRGACGALGLAAFFFAVSVMDLGDATTVFFTGPIFTAIFAHIFLGEHISVAAATASVMSLAGVTLVSRPAFIFGSKTLEPPTPLELAGVASALAGAVLSAAAYVIVRKFSTTVHFMVSVVWFGLVSSSLSPMALIILQRPVWRPTPVQWAVLSGAGLAAFVGQCLLNAGLQLAPAGPGTVMRNLDVVFAFLYQVFLLHDAAKPTSVAGASLVTLSAALIVAAKWRSTSRQRRGA